MIKRLKERARQIKSNISALYLALLHKDTKWYAKAMAFAVIAYALSPIDLIPDFIPILGLLDDIVLIPLGILIVIKMIPKYVWQECIQKAESGVNINPKYRRLGASVIILIWLAILSVIILSFVK